MNRSGVIEEPVSALAEYGGISIAFEVSEMFDVIAEADGCARLDVRRVPAPYVKDYDAIDGGPMRWAERFDLSNWGFFSALRDAQCVGRAAVARDTSALEMLEGLSDVALLWDIRVAPFARRRGVGSALFDAVVTWGPLAGLPSTQGRDPEHQRGRVPILRAGRLRTSDSSMGCISSIAGRGSIDLVQGPRPVRRRLRGGTRAVLKLGMPRMEAADPGVCSRRRLARQ